MTRQESFKRRIRARMENTGERYAAARRALVQQSTAEDGRTWAAAPETSDEAIREATGRGWNEWCDILDAWPGDPSDHPAMVAFVQEEYDVSGWWSQSVAVGYERITGLRLPYQQPDGTFSAGKSRTVDIDPGLLRAMLLDDRDREDLFGGQTTHLRSKPTAKVLRVGIGSGVAQIAIDPQPNGRVKVTIAHERLPHSEDVEVWKAYWDEWLADLEEE